jgi:hypothetical protein
LPVSAHPVACRRSNALYERYSLGEIVPPYGKLAKALGKSRDDDVAAPYVGIPFNAI